MLSLKISYLKSDDAESKDEGISQISKLAAVKSPTRCDLRPRDVGRQPEVLAPDHVIDQIPDLGQGHDTQQS